MVSSPTSREHVTEETVNRIDRRNKAKRHADALDIELVAVERSSYAVLQQMADAAGRTPREELALLLQKIKKANLPWLVTREEFNKEETT